MRMKTAAGILLGLSAAMVAGGHSMGQGPDPTGPPKADAPPEKAEQEGLDTLRERRAKGRQELRRIEAQLAEQRDEVRRVDESLRAFVSKGVDRLVGQLRQHPVPPSRDADRLALFLIDVEKAEVTRIADEAAPGLTFCGSPAWSSDGRRLLLDATPAPGNQFQLTRLLSIGIGPRGPLVTDLGPGNCPFETPDGDRIDFLLNSGAMPGAEPGIWSMQADGSGRRPLASYGRPLPSPDGRQLLIVSFSNPCQMTLVDLETRAERPLRVEGRQIYLVPSWAADGTIAVVLGDDVPEQVALLDVSDPEAVKVKEVLWTKGNGLDVRPGDPAYSAVTRRYYFIGRGDEGSAIYSVERGGAAPPRRLEAQGFDTKLFALSCSPDGRYLIFCSDRPDRRPK